MTILRIARGFTLLELLIGLAIAAIVMLPLSDMLRTGADSARFVRANLDQNADARFAMGRIAAQTTLPDRPKQGAANAGNPPAWVAPLQYALTNGALVETDPDAKPVRKSVLATGVRSFELRIPDVGTGYPLLRIDLVLDRPDCDAADGQDCTVALSRTVRLRAAP